MKKVVIFLVFLILFLPIKINGEELISVKFNDCVDGDTAKIILNNRKITIRLLAVDTPETKHPSKGSEFYGKEASFYTCNKLKTANKIQIEYDKNSDKKDKYDRHLVWLWIDNNLFQKELVRNGYAKIAYLYGNYKYTPILKQEEKLAQQEQLGIWQDQKEIQKQQYILLFIVILMIIIGCLVNTKFRKKIQRKIKKQIKKEFR